jgi:uncharacterized protein (DUF433 family)
MPTSEYVENHNGGYYIAGTRIGLDVVTHDFRRGRSPEAIFEAYPSIGSLAKVYGAITFTLEHPAEVDAYLKDQERIFEEIKAPKCPHCEATWKPRPARRETTGPLPVSCPRCKRPMVADPSTCGCHYCIDRRAHENV